MRPYERVTRAAPVLAAAIVLSTGCSHPTLVFGLETTLCGGYADTLEGVFRDVDGEDEASFSIAVMEDLATWKGAAEVVFDAETEVRIRRPHECRLTLAAVAGGVTQCVGLLDFPCRFVFAGDTVGTLLLQAPGTCTEDGFCNGLAGEDCTSCPADCTVCTGFCGDGACDLGEDCTFCPSDCGCLGCGDGLCGVCEGEDPQSCPLDCGSCGNLSCDPSSGEDVFTCPQDCATCGDGMCNPEGRENATSCSTDCTPTGVACGDDLCEPSFPGGREDCSSCAADCGPCLPGPFCGDGVCALTAAVAENCNTCPIDCNCVSCGDATCDAGETCWNCPEDCGGGCPTACDDAVCDVATECGLCSECPFVPVG